MTPEEQLKQLRITNPEALTFVEAMIYNTTREYMLKSGIEAPRASITPQQILQIIQLVCKVVGPVCTIIDNINMLEEDS